MDLQPKLAAAEAKPSVLLSSPSFFGNNQPTPPSPVSAAAAPVTGGVANPPSSINVLSLQKPALGPSPLASTPAPVLSSVAPQQFPLQPVPQYKPKPQPAQVRFLSDHQPQQQQQRPAEIRFAPAPLKVPLVRPLLAAGQQPASSAPSPSLRPSYVPNTAYLMDQPPRPPNPTGGPGGPQMMRPPMGPPRTGTPTQPQPPRPGPGMFVGGQHPPGVPMPMRPQMPPGTGVPGMQPRPPSAQGMQRPPTMMMGQPSPIRPPPPVMSGPRPTISPQNSNLGGGVPQHPQQAPGTMGQGSRPPQQPHQGTGSPYGPGSPDPQGGGGSPFGLQQGGGPNNNSRPPSTNMRPAYYPNRPPMGTPMGGDQQSRPPSGVDGSGLPSATHSIDDDEDVVIGKITPESPNPARGPPRNFTMPGPMGAGPYPVSGEREKSIPSRPPSVSGNYKSSNELTDPNEGPGGARPLHALKDFIQKDQQRAGSPGQSPSSPGSQQLSPANTDENFSYRPGSKPHGQPQQPQQQYKMAPGSQPTGMGRDGEKVTFQMPNGAGSGPPQDWNGRSRPPLQQQQPMARNPMGPMKPSADQQQQRHKGDNDSGVDEYTQEKDRPNAPTSPASPLKSPSKIPGLARRPDNIASESRSRSTSKQRANAKTPETPSEQPLIKKVPMNKIQVGGTPSPNLKVVKSKIGSLENTSHKPGGGNVKIETKKLDIKASARIEAKNEAYIPKGGDKKIISTKLQWNAKPKIGSLDNAAHKPGGGDKRIESIKTDFKERAKPKIGSKDNITYKPGGGDVKIVHQKLDIKAESKIGSLDNLKHKPGGGDKKIFDDKEYLKNIEHPITPSPSTQLDGTEECSYNSNTEPEEQLE
ncbi:basic proline-rich protein-like [Anopheles albimanus]|uniref:basic proline-rich protein-like n=1 Tax=Anopheles albimanus TaxID=7167 RepID=UPI00163EF7FE|nr:basic proline-rich protein-like [Anopheles albimanus]